MQHSTHKAQKVSEAKSNTFFKSKKATQTALPESIELEIISTATLNISSVDFPNLYAAW